MKSITMSVLQIQLAQRVCLKLFKDKVLFGRFMALVTTDGSIANYKNCFQTAKEKLKIQKPKGKTETPKFKM